MKSFFQEKLFCRIFHVLAMVMYVLLFAFCLGLTGENRSLDEHIILKKDFVVLNAFWICAALVCLFHVGKLSDRIQSRKGWNRLLGGVRALSALAGFLWVFASKTVPGADQLIVCRYADAFNSGEITMLDRKEYVVLYPYQLGVITVLRGVFSIFGPGNYQAFQYLTAALVPLLVFSGCQIVRILSCENRRAELYYLLFIFFCFPMYAYTSFVYGDLISIIFGLCAVWMYLACLKQFSWWQAVLSGVLMGMAVQLRAAMIILCLALLITGGIKLLFHRNRKYVIAMALLVLGVALMRQAVRGLYSDVMPEKASSIPTFLTIVMGLNDDNGWGGWHNGYDQQTFLAFDCDEEQAQKQAYQDFQDYLAGYRKNPGSMASFFIRKMNNQWNAPMYQSTIMNSESDGQRPVLLESLFQEGKAAKLVTFGMKLYQLLLYGSILFLLVRKRKDFDRMEEYALLAAVFGGFLFTLVWEAKTRYALPYLFMQIPYMAMGVNEISLFLEKWLKKTGKK